MARLLRVFGPAAAIRLTPEQAAEKKPVWIQAAMEGKWKGHPAHDVVEFTKAVFETVIKNFRANPSYKAGADGVGTEPVVRLDYEHLSEMPPPVVEGASEHGIPAPGWVLDLQLRDGAAGKVELWALVDMGDTLWSQVSKKEYRWTSVAIDLNGVDRESGKDIGATLTSLAITNNPFILGMEPMSVAASNRIAATAGAACLYQDDKGQRVLAGMDVYGTAENAEEALFGLRDIFGLPSDADAAVVQQQLDELRGMLLDGAASEDGRQLHYLVDRIRSLLGMRVLASREEVFEEAARVLSETEATSETTTETPADQPPAESAQQLSLPINKNSHARGVTRPAAKQSTGARMKTLAERLAAALNLRNADDDTIVDTVKSAIALRPRLAATFKLSADADDDKVVKAAEDTAEEAEKAEKAEEAKSAIDDLMELFGSTSTQDVLTRAAKLTEEAKRVEPLVAALTEALQQLTTKDEEEAEEEVSAIAASMGLDDKVKKLVLSARKSCFEEKEFETSAGVKLPGVKVRFVNQTKLEQFRKDWPLPEGPDGKVLTSHVFAGPNGAQLGGSGTGAKAPATQLLTAEQQKQGGAKPTDELKKKLALHEGRNDIEKAISLLCTEAPTFANRPYSEQVRLASGYLKTGEFPGA